MDRERPQVKPRPCRRAGCEELVYDLRHERTGFLAAINAEPVEISRLMNVPRGNITVDLERGTYRVLGSVELGVMDPAERAKLRLNHYVTCRQPYRRH